MGVTRYFLKLIIFWEGYLYCFLALTDHGNHTEDSPFLSASDTSGKRSEFYDRNLALFEVCLLVCFSGSSFLVPRSWHPSLFSPPGGDGQPAQGFVPSQPLGHLHQHHAGGEGAWGRGEHSGLIQENSQGQPALCLFFFLIILHFFRKPDAHPPPPSPRLEF